MRVKRGRTSSLLHEQTAIRERQFLKSMIPHHAGAILMCEQATLQDPEIVRLCESIKRGQQAEIGPSYAFAARSPPTQSGKQQKPRASARGFRTMNAVA